MKFLGFAGVLCALAAFGEMGRAQTLPPEAAKARETVKLLDEALKPLRSGDYDKELRRTVLRVLLELQPQVEALKPWAPAQAWRKLSADVNDAVDQEKEFWAARPRNSPRELPRGTASPLIRKASEIAADFLQLFPETPAQRIPRGAAPAERAKIAGIDAAAARRAGAARSLPGRFFDGALTAATPPVAAAPQARSLARPRANSGNLPLEPTYQLRVGAVPAPTPEEAACRKASEGGAFASGCGKNWALSRAAPLMTGLFDAFKEQFGTVSGIVTNLALMVGGLILGALSGIGMLIGVVKALCAVAILPVAYSMIRQLASAMAAMAATKKSDVRHWQALREVGKIGGALMIMVLLSFVGYKLGGTQSAKKAVGSMAEALQSKLGGRIPAPKPKVPERGVRETSQKDEPAAAARKPDPNRSRVAQRATRSAVATSAKSVARNKYSESRLTLEEGTAPSTPAARTSAPSHRKTVAHRGAASAVATSATTPQPAPAAAPVVPAAPAPVSAPPAGIKPPQSPVPNAAPSAAPVSNSGHAASRLALGEKASPPAAAAPAVPRTLTDVEAVRRYVRSVAGDVRLTPEQTKELVGQSLRQRGISPGSPRADAVWRELVPSLSANDQRAVTALSPSLRPHTGTLLELADEQRTTPAAIQAVLVRQGILNEVGSLETSEFKTQVGYALRRDGLELAVKAYPENTQGTFMRNIAANMTAPAGKSIEEVTRDGVFAYVDFSGATVRKVATGRDPDVRSFQVVFYITRTGKLWHISGYRQNRPTGRGDAQLIDFLKRWLVDGGVPASDIDIPLSPRP